MNTMKYQKGFSVLLTILIIAVVLVSAGGFIYYKTTPTSQIQEITKAIVPAIEPSGTSPIVQNVTEKVVERLAQTRIDSINKQRQQGSNQMLQSNLGYFRAKAEGYFSSPNGYGIPVTGTLGCSKPGSMFTSNVYTGNTNYKPLFDPTDYPAGIELTCNVSADGQSYAIGASLLGGGYWCVDSSNHLTSGGQSKAETVPLGTRTVCQ